MPIVTVTTPVTGTATAKKIQCDEAGCTAEVECIGGKPALDGWVDVGPLLVAGPKKYHLFYCPTHASAKGLLVGKLHPDYPED